MNEMYSYFEEKFNIYWYIELVSYGVRYNQDGWTDLCMDDYDEEKQILYKNSVWD